VVAPLALAEGLGEFAGVLEANGEPEAPRLLDGLPVGEALGEGDSSSVGEGLDRAPATPTAPVHAATTRSPVKSAAIER